MNFFFFLFLLVFTHLSADDIMLSSKPLEECFRKINDKIEKSEIQNIDFIYLINLDKRPERLKSSLEQLSIYNIHPYRFQAVYGIDLSIEEINSLGLTFNPHIKSRQWVLTPSSKKDLEYDFLRSSFKGKNFFSIFMNRGAIGCALSHLSILQDAYDAGYKTIWVLEDDILVNSDPHKLTELMNELDTLTGESGWDILYTDTDKFKERTDIHEEFWWRPRPDFISLDKSNFSKRSKINKNFIKIASRPGTHSMVIRRSGMKKILDHIKTHRLFFPYDHEIAFAEEIQLYMLRYPFVTKMDSPSDIQGT